MRAVERGEPALDRPALGERAWESLRRPSVEDGGDTVQACGEPYQTVALDVRFCGRPAGHEPASSHYPRPFPTDARPHRLCAVCDVPVVDGEIAEIGPRIFHNGGPEPTCLDRYEERLRTARSVRVGDKL